MVLQLHNDTIVYVENVFPYMDSLLRIVNKSLYCLKICRISLCYGICLGDLN